MSSSKPPRRTSRLGIRGWGRPVRRARSSQSSWVRRARRARSAKRRPRKGFHMAGSISEGPPVSKHDPSTRTESDMLRQCKRHTSVPGAEGSCAGSRRRPTRCTACRSWCARHAGWHVFGGSTGSGGYRHHSGGRSHLPGCCSVMWRCWRYWARFWLCSRC